MEETLVSYTIAVLAKDKGFNLRTESLYRSATKIIGSIHGYDFDIAAPTQTALQKWLRDNHNIHVSIYPIRNYWEMDVRDCDMSNRIHSSVFVDRDNMCESYEQALEEGLKEALGQLTK